MIIGGVLIGITAALGGLYHSGKSAGKEQCSNLQLITVQEDIRIHGDTENKVFKLNDPDLDDRLIKWMRN